MKYLRWALGAAVGLWTVRGLFYLALTAGAKAGALPMTGEAASAKPFVDAVSIWQLLLWGASYVLYAVATVRHFRGGNALVPLALAYALDIVLYLTFRVMPAYLAEPEMRQIDQIALAGLLVVLLLTWWAERSSRPAAASA